MPSARSRHGWRRSRARNPSCSARPSQGATASAQQAQRLASQASDLKDLIERAEAAERAREAREAEARRKREAEAARTRRRRGGQPAVRRLVPATASPAERPAVATAPALPDPARPPNIRPFAQAQGRMVVPAAGDIVTGFGSEFSPKD